MWGGDPWSWSGSLQPVSVHGSAVAAERRESDAGCGGNGAGSWEARLGVSSRAGRGGRRVLVCFLFRLGKELLRRKKKNTQRHRCRRRLVSPLRGPLVPRSGTTACACARVCWRAPGPSRARPAAAQLGRGTPFFFPSPWLARSAYHVDLKKNY